MTAENKKVERNQRRSLVGVVTSDKSTQTITVQVERTTKHRKYGKFVRSHKSHIAHDEKEVARPGDRVEIEATRPLSKTKRWRLAKIVTSNSQFELSSAEGEIVNRTTEETAGKNKPTTEGDA
ncbi:MAG: small subunit ribosomal protein S17 [Planctomycetota bacterium]|jgi:small subunit ribosomal protein S17